MLQDYNEMQDQISERVKNQVHLQFILDFTKYCNDHKYNCKDFLAFKTRQLVEMKVFSYIINKKKQ